MSEPLPRRPGFTVGQEETLWEGSPALSSTLYFWFISLIGAATIAYAWSHLVNGLYAEGVFSSIPGLSRLMFPNPPEAALWVRLAPIIFCLMPVLWYSLGLACTSYKLTNQRIIIRTGIFMRTHDQVELFRVRDFLIDAPLHYVVLGLGHVRVISRDESLPLLTLIAQPQPDRLIDLIRDNVQRRKDEVGMREIETNTQ